MAFRKKLGFLLTSVLMIGLLAGCGSKAATTAASTNTAEPAAAAKKLTVIKIATQSPLSGASATQGESIKLGAQMSLDDHKADFEKLGFDLQLVPYDDQADPKKGVANAELVGADQSILGVVGHMNSGVAIPSSVVYEKYNVVMVSPTNTATEVTDRKLKAVNRICARDDFQGPAAADYAVNTAKAKNIFVIQDKTAYGQGLADAFKSSATKLGAQIVGYEGITVGEKDFNGVLSQVLNKKADFIFFGGMYAEGGLLIKQAREKGIDVPIMGGDGLDSSTIVQIAGDNIKNTYYSSIATDINKTDEGKKWAQRYKSTFSKNPEGYSVYGYDSMSVLLTGLQSAIKANDGKLPSRIQVRDAVRAIQDFQGVATKVGFDSIGDNKYAKVFIYKFDGATYPGTYVSEVSK